MNIFKPVAAKPTQSKLVNHVALIGNVEKPIVHSDAKYTELNIKFIRATAKCAELELKLQNSMSECESLKKNEHARSESINKISLAKAPVQGFAHLAK